MKDRIEIRDLRALAAVGVADEERREPQDVLISLRLTTDTRAAAAADRLEDTVDYSDVAARVVELAESSDFHLLERLAAEIAQLCLEESGVSEVRVTVEKPGALPAARSVGVTIERKRKKKKKDD